MRVIYEFIIEHLHGRILRDPPVQVTVVVPMYCVAICDHQLSVGRVGFLCLQVPLTLFVSPADGSRCVLLRPPHRDVIITDFVDVCPFLEGGWISSSPIAFRNCWIVLCRWGCICFGAAGGCWRTVANWIPCRRVGRG